MLQGVAAGASQKNSDRMISTKAWIETAAEALRASESTAAEAALRRVQLLDPADPWSLRLLYARAMDARDFDLAQQRLGRRVAVEPFDVVARIDYARLVSDSGDGARAEAILRGGLARSAAREDLHLALADVR